MLSLRRLCQELNYSYNGLIQRIMLLQLIILDVYSNKDYIDILRSGLLLAVFDMLDA